MSVRRTSRRRYARGRHALGECQRSGKVMPLNQLVVDGNVPGLLVAPEWWEPQHPQEIPVDVTDPVALQHPSPEISVPSGEYDDLSTWQNNVAGDCAASPDTSEYLATAQLAAAAVAGESRFILDRQVSYELRICVYIELDAGGWWVSKASRDAENNIVLNTLTPFPSGSAAAIGNQVYLAVDGGGGITAGKTTLTATWSSPA